MTAMRDDGERMSRGQLHRRVNDATAIRDSLIWAVLFGGVVLINGILGILMIGFFQSIGVWEVQPAAGDTLSSPFEAGGHAYAGVRSTGP